MPIASGNLGSYRLNPLPMNLGFYQIIHSQIGTSQLDMSVHLSMYLDQFQLDLVDKEESLIMKKKKKVKNDMKKKHLFIFY